MLLHVCCSSVFWKCVHTVPVVPFKLKGSDILWICYFFLLLIMGELYPQTKNAIKVCTKHERVPPGSSSRNILNSLLLIYWAEFHFSGPEDRTSQKKCAWLKLTPQKENCKISNNFLFLLILIWPRSLQLQWWWCVQSFC